MPERPAKLSVFAIVQAPETNVVSAAHPTEARNPDYKPPFRHEFVASPDEALDEDRVLQYVGTAHQQKDGSFRIELVDTPLSRTLIIRPQQKKR